MFTVYLIYLTYFSSVEIEAVCLVDSLLPLHAAPVHVCYTPEWISPLNYDFALQLLKSHQKNTHLHYLNAHCVHCRSTAIAVTKSTDDGSRCSYHCLNCLFADCQWTDLDSELVLMFDGGRF